MTGVGYLLMFHDCKKITRFLSRNLAVLSSLKLTFRFNCDAVLSILFFFHLVNSVYVASFCDSLLVDHNILDYCNNVHTRLPTYKIRRDFLCRKGETRYEE